jgi:hypothetical protein
MEKIKTLLLYSKGAPTISQILIDTACGRVTRLPQNLLAPRWLNKLGVIGKKISYRMNDPYSALGYVNDWRDAFIGSRNLDITQCNINNLASYTRLKPIIKEAELIIVLHSAAGDDMRLLNATSHWFHNRRGRLAVFFGNEYDLLKAKRNFLHQAGADYVCSQLPRRSADFIYADCGGAKILEMPHALNPSAYKVITPREYRKNKIGFIGARYPLWIGDTVRNDFLDFCLNAINEADRAIQVGKGNVSREQWANFLNMSIGTIGAEAGTYYLDKDGYILKMAKKIFSKNNKEPESLLKFHDVLKQVNYVSGKAISSRHFEPIGTKTVQLLIEGEYNGILKPDVHYLPVKKDYSNFFEKMSELNDPYRQTEISNCAFEYAMDCHTYHHRVNKFIQLALD